MSDIGNYQISAPVAFFVFNRPDTTKLVFESIKLARPPVLLIIADGPRQVCPDDQERCKSVRNIVAEVDWPCKVLKNYADTNLGCRKRMSTGLDWVYTQVPEAIILEDDCLPDQTFFRFCDEHLELYREDERVMTICGTNALFGADVGENSYYFSNFNQVWGWATWRRTWNKYDLEMKGWPALRDSGWLAKKIPERSLWRYWERIFEFTYNGSLMTWDYQLAFVCMVNNGLSIVPRTNLISNLGFGPDATITKTSHKLANIPIKPIEFPLVHPPEVAVATDLDIITSNNSFFRPLLSLRLIKILSKIRRWKLGS